MTVLVEYACGTCQARFEAWVERPIPETTACGGCAGPAHRRFGGALLRGALPTGTPAEREGPECHAVPGIPGACALIPTAARTLAARARGDNRALEAEQAHQEAAIAAGTLDPAASPITPHAAAGGGRQIKG